MPLKLAQKCASEDSLVLACLQCNGVKSTWDLPCCWEKLGGKPGCPEGLLNVIKAFLTVRMGMRKAFATVLFDQWTGGLHYLG